MLSKMLVLAMLAVGGADAAPVVGVSFGSNSGCCGNLNVTVTGLGPSEVLQAQIVYGIDTVYVDGRPNPGPFAQDFTQGLQLVSNGTFYVGTFGQNYSTTAHDNLRYLSLAIASNVSGQLGTWLVSPEVGQQYVSLGPVRNVAPTGEVPEPMTALMVGAGLVAVARWRRCRS